MLLPKNSGLSRWVPVFFLTPCLLFAEMVIEGQVRNNLGFALGGVSVKLTSRSENAITDSLGRFLIGAIGSPVSLQRQSSSAFFDYLPDRIVVRGYRGHSLSAKIYTVQGRLVSALHEGIIPAQDFDLHALKARSADGTFLLVMRINSYTVTSRVVALGGKLIWQNKELPVLQNSLQKTASIDQLNVEKEGHKSVTISITADTTLGMTITLFPSASPALAKVNWSSKTETKPMHSCNTYGSSYYTWLESQLKAYNNCSASGQPSSDVSYKVITLDNGLISVDVAPELGMRVVRAIDKTMDPPVDFFFENEDFFAHRWTLLGGVEPSFPFYETGTDAAQQQAGYRLIEQADGAMTVAMNMRMDHRQLEEDMGFIGKYGDRPLSCWVTLKPGSSLFEVTYRSDNHNPTRRSNRLWNNVQYPRTGSEVIFPTHWAMDHAVKASWKVGGVPRAGSLSQFALRPLGFCGAWYQTPGVNRLRITDPLHAPGMKLYYDKGVAYDYFEFWGSTNRVFEAPEKFVQEYQPVQMSFKFYTTRTIAKVVFANEYLAVAMPDRGSFEMTATGYHKATIKNGDGSVIIDNKDIGPDLKLSGSFSEQVQVLFDGFEVFNGPLPPKMDTSSSGIDGLRASAINSWAWNTNYSAPSSYKFSTALNLKTSDALRFAQNIELEDVQSRWETLSAFAVAFVSPPVIAGLDRNKILCLARTCYKLGRLTRARAFIAAAGATADAESDYLKGLIAWEDKTPVNFGVAGVKANYHRALEAVAAQKPDSAIALLKNYLTYNPGAFRPRLLLAYLAKDVALAARLSAENPGSPEALYVLKELGYSVKPEDFTSLVDTTTGSHLALQDFITEANSGAWRHGKRYETVPGPLSAAFPFPEHLHYEVPRP